MSRPPTTARADRGFTLLELMIVVVVIAIIAAISVPSFLQSRAVADQAAVVSTLRAICTGQFRFKTMALVDTNNDGGYEYGTMREMTGGAIVRGDVSERLAPNLLPMSLDQIDAQGRIVKNGYYLALYLPGAGGVGLADIPANLPNVEPQRASNFWAMVAWPVRRGQSGVATYFVNLQGEILRSTNAPYSGLTNIPPAGPALLGTGDPSRIDSNLLGVNAVGADGYNWTPVR